MKSIIDIKKELDTKMADMAALTEVVDIIASMIKSEKEYAESYKEQAEDEESESNKRYSLEQADHHERKADALTRLANKLMGMK